MSMFRNAILSAALALSLAGSGTAAYAQASEEDDALLDASEPTQIEFVQQADGLTYANGRLELTKPAPMTVFFADRPRRFTGHMRNSDFANYWTAAADGFGADPPNAAVVIADSDAPPVIVELKSFALGDDGTLSYEVEVLEGDLPAQGANVALFIDPVAYLGPRVGFYAGPRGGVAVVGRRPLYRPLVVHPRGAVIVRPRCRYSPYYGHDVCRLY
jgi:hypothetical protein